ncbi:MAG: MBL fold metallo-hydrolase, partial [Chitinophagaceae bacterium]
HTPGHTLESTTYLLFDENGKPHCIFSGDTLFIGDVGRPDLAQKGELTMNDLAGILYDSLHSKIMTLPNEVIVYPGHGAGSACGKSMSKETFDTLGHQKEVNYALKATSKEQFIKEVTDGILPPPQYFAKNAALNKGGYTNMDQVYQQGLQALLPQAFEDIANQTGALVLDTRDPQQFAKAFVPNSINIGLNGQFAPWVGALITDEGKAEETITRLARVGYDNTIGYLAGGIEAWQKAGKETDNITSITASEFEKAVNDHPAIHALDVRKPGEYEAEHLENTLTRPLDYINDWTPELKPQETYYIHCAGGYRSMIAASILKARGIANVIDIAGGYGAIKETNLKRTDFACPSKAMKV